ncbi:multiple coagulation factor deficiency protein 2 homolog isoform X1 [Planococcus citri]|uniref:multiple coagulation factor deficiency protein 2 homolog isoform X1 n=1 Tax=Planococcus citri TaxID=170843 RepID=UPI0031F76482
MNEFTTYSLCGIFLFLHYVSCNIGGPPGVNPHIYNTDSQFQPQPGPGVGQAYNQQPVQNVQFAAHQQHQQPVHVNQGPVHGHAHQDRKPVLHSSNIQHEKEHIQEHMEVPLDTSKMSEQELQFHYFKMHDADNNNKLDGCELIKSLIHWHELHESIDLTDEFFSQSIDDILNRVDFNWDGYIDYTEYASTVTFDQVKDFHHEYQNVVAKKQETSENESPPNP